MEYENLNSDLPRDTRRLMGLFAIAPSVPASSLNELVEGELSTSLTAHRSWFWYNAMRLAGLQEYWDEFCHRRNNGHTMRECLYWLKYNVTPEQWELFSRRVGKDHNIFPSNHSRTPLTDRIWTKGGVWWKSSPFTKLLVEKEHITREYPGVGWCGRLDAQELRKLERELQNLIDPDRMLVPEAKSRAVQYVRRRTPELLGYDTDKCAGWESVSWFFQTPICTPNGFWHHYDPAYDSATRKKTRRHDRWQTWDW